MGMLTFFTGKNGLKSRILILDLCLSFLKLFSLQFLWKLAYIFLL